MKFNGKKIKFRKGQAVLEVALILPWFMLTIAVIIQGAVVMHMKQHIHMAVRYAARAKSFGTKTKTIKSGIDNYFWKNPIPKGDLINRHISSSNMLNNFPGSRPPGGECTIRYKKGLMFNKKWGAFKNVYFEAGALDGNRIAIDPINYRM